MRSFDSRPIGIFDSGLGGLTVAAAVRRLLPGEDIVYLGDTARAPYGNRSPGTITAFAADDMDFLIGKQVKAVVAACNTVSAIALEKLCERHPEVPVSGVIQPGAEAAVRTGGRRIAVLGTRATVRSGAYPKALRALSDGLEISAFACPLFVPLVEEGILNGPLADAVFDLYLHDFQTNPPDVVLLGCTHYPLFEPALKKWLPPSVAVIDSAGACAASLKQELEEKGLAAPPGRGGALTLYASDITPTFREQTAAFFGASVPESRLAVLN